MIEIVRGSILEVRNAVQGRGGRLVEAAPAGVAWGATRRLLASLRAEHGDAAFEAGLREHADAVSLVLRRLPPADLAAQARLRASEDGLLTHNPVMRRPLQRALSALIRPLLAGQPLGVPDVSALDLPTLGVLLDLALRPDGLAHLTLGLPARPLSDHPLWRREPDLLHDALALLALREDVTQTTLSLAEPDDSPAIVHDGPWDPLDDRVEQDAIARLARGGPLDAAHSAQILAACRAAFASYDAHAALRLGLGLLSAEAALSATARARLHRCVALAAYNRQVQSDGNAGLAQFLDDHLLAAWRLEPDAAARSHLAYRLCINRSRRRGDLDEGARWGAEAIAAADGLPPGAAAWHRAWGRNGLAYVRARQGRLDDAITEMRAAWADAETLSPEDAPGDELPWTRVVLADNLAELHQRAGDAAGAERWQDTLLALERAHEGEPLMAYGRKLALLREQRRLVEAEQIAGLAITAAERRLDPDLCDRYRLERADLRYRLGDATGAWQDLETTLAVRERSESNEDRARARVSTALAASRAGEAQRALELLDAALQEEAEASRQIELLAGIGLICARAGDGEAAEQTMNAAIEGAVGLGQRDVLLRVAVATGEALLALGRPDEAAPAFQRAIELARLGDDPAAPADAYAALAGLLMVAPDPALAEAALTLLPAALEEAETWHRLEALRLMRPTSVAQLIPIG